MKLRNSILSIILNVCILLSSPFIFTSCKIGENVTPKDEEITFRVDLVKIAALEIKDAEGENLEIYGVIGSKLIRGNITEENTLLSLKDTEPLPVGMSDEPLVSSVTYKVASSNIDDSNLEVSAHLFDFDGGGSNAPEDLGNEKISTPLGSVLSSTNYQITLNKSSGQIVQLTYSITRL